MKKAGPGQMGSMFSEDSMKQMISRSMVGFPDEVKKGQTWDAKVETPNPVVGKQIVETEYRYAGPEERDGRSAEKIDVEIKLSFESGPNAQAKVTMKDQSGKGVIYFDNQQGLPLETDVTSKMTLEIAVGDKTFEQAVTTKVAMKQVAPATTQ